MDPGLVKQFWEWKINELGRRVVKGAGPRTHDEYAALLAPMQLALDNGYPPKKGTGDFTDWHYWKITRPALTASPCPSRMKSYYDLRPIS